MGLLQGRYSTPSSVACVEDFPYITPGNELVLKMSVRPTMPALHHTTRESVGAEKAILRWWLHRRLRRWSDTLELVLSLRSWGTARLKWCSCSLGVHPETHSANRLNSSVNTRTKSVSRVGRLVYFGVSLHLSVLSQRTESIYMETNTKIRSLDYLVPGPLFL